MIRRRDNFVMSRDSSDVYWINKNKEISHDYNKKEFLFFYFVFYLTFCNDSEFITKVI
jgi:hypothetical protein